MVESKRTEEHFRQLFEAAPNGIIAVDAAGCIVMLNAQVEKMFNYSHAELIGRPIELLVPERFRRSHLGLRKKFAAAPQLRPMGTGRDLIGMRKDGSEFAVEVGLNPTIMGMGEVVIVTVIDITERKRAAEEESLQKHARENIEFYQQLGMPAAILQHDGRVLLMNPLFNKLSPQFVVRGDQIGAASPMANQLLKQALARLDHRNDGMSVAPIPVPAADGHPPFIFYLLPIKASFGSKLGILIVKTLVARDVALPDMVQSLFALAPAEARVATLIGSGLAPRQAAEKLGISEGNVRTALKRVFKKLGVERQNELAALLTKIARR